MLPIVIGSAALNAYFDDIPKSNIKLIDDIDIICTKDEAVNLFDQADKKLDISVCKDDSSNMYIHNWCNDHKDLCKIMKFNFGDCLVPPIELLYVIYKSHIHRILPITQNQKTNIEIWFSYMKKYTFLRQKLNYKTLDMMLGKCYDDLIQHAAYDIFYKRFNEVNKRVGDTNYKMDQDAESFFDDSVKRYINHDVLHSKISVLERNVSEPLFKKYQKDGSVAIDYELFRNGIQSEKIQMFREEVMVLLLERCMIPELVECYKEKELKFDGYDINYLKGKIIEIGAHLITNLSGNGHHFLRTFALDHVTYILDIESFNYANLEKLAVEISQVDKTNAKLNNITRAKFIETLLQTQTKLKEIDADFPQIKQSVQFNTKNCLINKIMNEIKNKDSPLVANINGVTYFIDSNIGIFKDDSNIFTVFRVSKVSVSNGCVSFDIESVTLDGNSEDDISEISSFCPSFIRVSKQIYYKSESCEFYSNLVAEESLYVNTYGNAPAAIHNFLEILGKKCLYMDGETFKISNGINLSETLTIKYGAIKVYESDDDDGSYY